MPYMRFDPESFDEYADEIGDDVDLGERPTGEYDYETAEAVFKAEKLTPESAKTVEALKLIGATAFKVKYDGGYDEGFSHPTSVTFGDRERTIDEAIAELSKARPGDTSKFPPEGKSIDRSVWANALDELAYELASRLLGDGFGTGEYSLYGEFNADLTTGQITDNPSAPKPADPMLD